MRTSKRLTRLPARRGAGISGRADGYAEQFGEKGGSVVRQARPVLAPGSGGPSVSLQTWDETADRQEDFLRALAEERQRRAPDPAFHTSSIRSSPRRSGHPNSQMSRTPGCPAFVHSQNVFEPERDAEVLASGAKRRIVSDHRIAWIGYPGVEQGEAAPSGNCESLNVHPLALCPRRRISW